MSFPSESDMMSKELQNLDLIYVNLVTDVLKFIAKYRHLLPSGNRALVSVASVGLDLHQANTY